MKTWTTKIITSFPEMFPGPLKYSIIGKALQRGIWSLETLNLRDSAFDQKGSIDEIPYGGGPGMIIRADVVEKCLKKVSENMETQLPLVYMTPSGKPLVQKKLEEFSDGPGVVLLCGRFEGIDERVLDAYNFERVSIGDFVISGGEIAAMTLIEGCVRLLPGVIGKKESLDFESFSNGLLEYPQYTKPQIWTDKMKVKHEVPDVLLSGNHEKIKEWRKNKSLEKTKKIRPDLVQDKK